MMGDEFLVEHLISGSGTQMLRIEQLKRGRKQWGCGGRHFGFGIPGCPRSLHHHHDPFCRLPTLGELAEAGVKEPSWGWESRR